MGSLFTNIGINRFFIACVYFPERCICRKCRICFSKIQKCFIKLSPAEFSKYYWIFFEKLEGPQNRFFLSAVYERYTTYHSLCKYSKRGVTPAWKNPIVCFVPAILIMITGKIHLNCIGGICRNII